MNRDHLGGKLLLAVALLVVLLMPLLGGRAEAVEPPQQPLSTATPAEVKISQARKMIAAQPETAQYHNDLALALTRRARETANPKFYVEAGAALERSLEVEPNNFTARKLQVWTLLGQHEFSKALAAATVLNKQTPDDILVYGYLTDANIELGNYEAAEKAAQWMLDMRPGNVPGLTRAAYLRELFGDIEGSLDFMIKAYERTPWQETEDRAWLLTHVAHLELSRGKLEAADRALAAALDLHPDYHYALAQMGKLRAAQGRQAEAVSALTRLLEVAPNPENFFPLGEAQRRAGMDDKAAATFAEFEPKALLEVAGWDNASRELIFYYADYAAKPHEALRIAEIEIGRRADIFTLDAHAWALHKNGEHAAARTQIEKALAVGIQDARIFYHAGMIAAALGDQVSARKHFTASLELNPHSEFSQLARTALQPATGLAADVRR